MLRYLLFFVYSVTILFADNNYKVYERSYSNSKIFSIESRIYTNDEPEIFLVDLSNNSNKRLTNNEFIEFNPVVNDNGDYAYAISEYSNAESTIVLNGKLIEDTIDKLLYKNLAISDNLLAFHESRFYDYTNFINIYDLNGTKVSRTPINGYIQKLYFLDSDTLILQIFRLNTSSMDIATFDIKKKELKYILNSTDDELLSNVDYGNTFDVDVIENKPNDLKLLFNTIYNYKNFQQEEPFSFGNDFMGRLAWNQSYRLEAMTKLYLLTNDEKILEEIDETISNMIQRVNEKQNISNEFNHKYSYATTKYSLDKKTKIGFMVHDGKIYYAMFNTINTIGA